MTDMLVNLLKLPPLGTAIDELRAKQNIVIRRANPWELTRAREFAQKNPMLRNPLP